MGKVQHIILEIETTAHQQIIPITRKVKQAVQQLGIIEGAVLVFVMHTTCGLTVNENADPDVEKDLLRRLQKLAPWKDPADLHTEGNSAAHLMSSLMGVSLYLPVHQGRLHFGTWQGVFLGEFDGPRIRKVIVKTV